MSAVFSHGQLRLYLLRAARGGAEARVREAHPRCSRAGSMVCTRASAGTIYPRLARMEADGLITHSASGGRKVYGITDAGRSELAERSDELAGLEAEIHAS